MNNVLNLFAKKPALDPHREDPYGRLNRALARLGIDKQLSGNTGVFETAEILLNAVADALERMEAHERNKG
jgi:hypothetical protein